MKEELKELDRLLRKGTPHQKPLACLYSGGLDSATAHYYYGGDKFNIIWDNYKTKDNGTSELSIIINKQRIEDEMQNVFRCFDRPIVETGIFPLYIAYKDLKQMGYNYVVTGDGGDELFLGYKWDKLALFKKGIEEHEIIQSLFGHHKYIADSLGKRFQITEFSPFFKLSIIKFVYNLPLKYKLNLYNDKILLRELMKDKIELRPKYYFHNPIQEWFKITKKEKAKWFLKKWLDARS